MNTKLKILIITLAFFSSFKVANAAITIRPALNLGLVGYWSMDEGSGDKAYDQSGNRNTGSASSSPSWVDGKIGKSLNFDGTDDEVIITNDVASYLNMTNGSISLWYKGNASTSQGDQLFSFANMGDEISIALYTWSSIKFTHHSDYGDVYGASMDIPEIDTDTNWHHVVASWDVNNPTEKLVLTWDGIRAATSAPITTPSSYSGTAYLGANNWNSYFAGSIDEVRIYNRALSAGEVTRLYNLTRPKLLAPNNTGLVGYWSFDEGLGTKAGDMSGGGNNGDLIGGSSWITGKRGKALEFSDTSKYVQIVDSPSLQISSQITLAAWVRRTTGVDNWKHVLCKTTATSSEYWLGYNSSNWPSIMINPGDADDSDRYYVYGDSATVTDTNWHYLVGTHDGTNVRVYFDGALVNTPQSHPGIFHTGDGTLGIGRCISQWGAYQSAGDIDEARIYNRALSAAEITTLYNSSKKIIKYNTSQNNKLTDGLVGMWSFNGPDLAGVIAYDRSGQNNNGTITGATIINGKVGQALSFNGSSAYVNIVDNSTLRPGNGNWSIAVWAKPANIDQASTLISKRENVNPYKQWSLWICGDERCMTNGKKLSVTYRTDNTDRRHSVTTENVADGNWHHFTMVADKNDNSVDSGTVSLYVDGVKFNITTYSNGVWPTIDNLQDVQIGSGNGSGYFGGPIDEVRVYNRALTAGEIRRLYQMGK